MTALNVKYNNDKSRDFTNPSLPPGDPGSEVIASAGGLVNASDLLLIAARQRPTITGDRIGGIYYLFMSFYLITFFPPYLYLYLLPMSIYLTIYLTIYLSSIYLFINIYDKNLMLENFILFGVCTENQLHLKSG